jgi:hypothetical protein
MATSRPRIYIPEHGWGTISSLSSNLLHNLYPDDPSQPEVLALVRWDSGGGGWVDPSNPKAVFEGAAELARMFREEVEPPSLPPFLPR